jgi:hypothetical protein
VSEAKPTAPKATKRGTRVSPVIPWMYGISGDPGSANAHPTDAMTAPSTARNGNWPLPDFLHFPAHTNTITRKMSIANAAQR